MFDFVCRSMEMHDFGIFTKRENLSRYFSDGERKMVSCPSGFFLRKITEKCTQNHATFTQMYATCTQSRKWGAEDLAEQSQTILLSHSSTSLLGFSISKVAQEVDTTTTSY